MWDSRGRGCFRRRRRRRGRTLLVCSKVFFVCGSLLEWRSCCLTSDNWSYVEVAEFSLLPVQNLRGVGELGVEIEFLDRLGGESMSGYIRYDRWENPNAIIVDHVRIEFDVVCASDSGCFAVDSWRFIRNFVVWRCGMESWFDQCKWTYVVGERNDNKQIRVSSSNRKEPGF